MSLSDEFSREGHRNFVALVVRSVIIFFAISLRLASKLMRRQKYPFGWDDFWIILAVVVNYGGTAATFYGLFRTHGGLPAFVLIQQGDVKAAQDYFLAEDIGALLFFAALWFTFWSVLAFYIRIFGLQEGFRRDAWILIVISGLWGVSSVLTTIMMCMPPSNFWKMIDLDKCGNYNVFTLCNGIFEIIIATTILALPIRPVMNLTLSLRTRLVILGIFALGAVVVITGIVRTISLYKPGSRQANTHNIMLWTAIHITSAIVAACLPVCRPIWSIISGASTSLADYYRNMIDSIRSGRSNASNRAQGSGKSESSSSLARERSGEPVAGPAKAVVVPEEYEMWNIGERVGDGMPNNA